MSPQASLGIIALKRFGYGPRLDDGVADATGDPRDRLAAELAQPDAALLSDPDLPSAKDALQRVFAERAARMLERAAAAPNASAPSAAGMAAPPSESSETTGKTKAPGPAQLIFRREALARVRRAVEAPVGFVERLVAFWSNHFCVSAAKGGFARATAGAFEREAIRPHVLGRFADMLLAVESHPAMLHYLDAARSIGPNSRAGQRWGRGLNENLGREILELHTLGVGSGYGQDDVTGLARILTGWTVVGPPGRLGEPGTFAFNSDAHEPGPIALLGRSYGDDGPGQGAVALADLARHPATARHLAAKLARAFVADEPAPALVARLARTFRDTDGNLREMARALIAAPESWSTATGRVRDPYEFVVAAHRLLGRVPDDPGTVLGPLREMGMALWQPPGPNGFPADAATWAAPEALKLRLDYAAAFAGRLRDPPDLQPVLKLLCGDRPSTATRDAVGRAESRSQGLALLLMSPEMQRS